MKRRVLPQDEELNSASVEKQQEFQDGMVKIIQNLKQNQINELRQKSSHLSDEEKRLLVYLLTQK